MSKRFPTSVLECVNMVKGPLLEFNGYAFPTSTLHLLLSELQVEKRGKYRLPD